MKRFIRALAVVVLMSLTAGELAAQTPSPSRTFSRVEASLLFGVWQPAVVVEEPGGLRTRPMVRDTGERYAAMTRDVTVRLSWNHRLSTIAGFGWSTEEMRSYSFPKPSLPPPPPFTTYVAERNVSYRYRLVGISQAWDLATGQVAPFVAGGVEFRSVVRTQRSTSVGYSDTSLRLSSFNERSGMQSSILAGGGVRLLLGRHVVLSAEGLVFLTDFETRGDTQIFNNQAEADSLFGRSRARWRVGVGARF